MDRLITINTGEMAVDRAEGKIRTSGIGSCVAITLYDSVSKVGGMAHAMLPSKENPDKDIVETARENISESTSISAKYVDDAIDGLLLGIEKLGGKKQNLKAKIAGGARMFQVLSGDQFGIGYKNVESAKKKLTDLGIMIESEETGGNVGRMAEIDLDSGLVEVTTKM